MSLYTSTSSNYDKTPTTHVRGYSTSIWQGWNDIVNTLKTAKKAHTSSSFTLVIDCYPGVNLKELETCLIAPLNADKVMNVEQARLSETELNTLLSPYLTDDRVFGVMCPYELDKFFDQQRIESLKQEVNNSKNEFTILYGGGASLVHHGDCLVYADLARWEIQQRFRHHGLSNWGCNNSHEDILTRYKRSYFVEWRAFDKHKTPRLKTTDYLLDTNQAGNPKLVSGDAFRAGLQQTVNQPFRVVPFFDPGVWGGQWMKKVCDLNPDKANYAWCFDCVPEENSLMMQFGDIRVEVPSQDLVLLHPLALLGKDNLARFGAEFPIRFDLLDTMGGQNLSLQVHPLTAYIKEQFHMPITQDESYYMLATKDDAIVYLGLKNDINPDEMMSELNQAQRGEKPFDADRFVNRFPAKPHDHFLIPAGTIHCSGHDSVVLEISATPYIFTFKLWDWGRVGLDGLPRPIHLEHGKKVIQWDRQTKWVEDNLVNHLVPISKGDGWREESTGLHELEFIETRRHWFTQIVPHSTRGTVNVLNLVQGEEAIVESPDNAFEPFIVHYAETFIIPANIDNYTLRPYGLSVGKELATIKAFVRHE